MKFAAYILIFLMTAGLLLFPVGEPMVFAQTPTIIYKNVRLWINPEYDDPRLLVMIQGQVVDFQGPLTVRFLVPSTAEMYSAGSMDINGKYSGGPPDRKFSSLSGWDEISYTLQTDTFRVEYYAPIIIGETDKTITYEFRSLNPISDLTVAVQQPRKTSNFNVIPAGAAAKDSEGFNVYTFTYSNLDTELPLKFQISYTKQESTLYSSILVISIIVVVLVIAGLWWMHTRVQHNNRATRRRSARTQMRKAPSLMQIPRATSPQAKSAPIDKQIEQNVCPVCGEVTDSEKLCLICGANLQY